MLQDLRRYEQVLFTDNVQRNISIGMFRFTDIGIATIFASDLVQ